MNAEVRMYDRLFADPHHVAGAKPVFNRVRGLKDSWGK